MSELRYSPTNMVKLEPVFGFSSLLKRMTCFILLDFDEICGTDNCWAETGFRLTKSPCLAIFLCIRVSKACKHACIIMVSTAVMRGCLPQSMANCVRGNSLSYRSYNMNSL